MAVTRRERQREATMEEIKEVARRQMAEHGAAALSLRAIAGEMGITAPAIYRYYPSRDELATALIVDAYRSLGGAIAAGQEAVDEADYAGRFLGAACAYRAWSLAHPAEFDLIFGTPIPGYHAPRQVTVPVVRAAFHVFLAVPEAAWRAGRLDLARGGVVAAPETDVRLAGYLADEGFSLPPVVFRLALEGWGQMHGLVTLERLGQTPPILGEPGEFYGAAMRSFVTRLGLPPAAD